MEERDTRLGKVEYILLHLAVGFLLYRFFTAEQYRLAPLLKYWRSVGPEHRRELLHRAIWIFSGGGLALTMGRLRYLPAAVLNLLMPYGVYLVWLGLKPRWLGMAVSFLLYYPFTAMVLRVPGSIRYSIRNGETTNDALKRCGSFLQRAHLYAGTAMGLLLVGVLGWTALSVGPETDPMKQPASPMSYMQELEGFGDKTWTELGREERLELLQQVVNAETDYLGLTEPPLLEEKVIPDPGIGLLEGGHYDRSENIVVINRRVLMSDELDYCFTVILHECYHAFQYELCSLGLPSGRNAFLRLAGQYEYGFRHYIEGDKHHKEYQKQRVEADARAYSEQRASAYSSILAELN